MRALVLTHSSTWCNIRSARKASSHISPAAEGSVLRNAWRTRPGSGSGPCSLTAAISDGELLSAKRCTHWPTNETWPGRITARVRRHERKISR